MNLPFVLLWGFAATVALTSVLVICRGLHLTRIDIPFMLGTLWTSDRHKANWTGFLAHVCMGWIFAIIYSLAFEDTGLHHWWFGALIGLVHATFVLTAGMGVVSNLHPRMATEERGPEPTRMLEPPGFFVLNYGKGTPLATYAAHIIYGGILGFFSGRL
ncbi:hypothetical protein ACJVC5_15745 [Peredibacter sp. HCB2-198]|uniref:hypothetical protein n=1 Tax=Peredibacter sp. HCB2-198 TaxID=3383025 RepID=UPI0038B6AF9C